MTPHYKGATDMNHTNTPAVVAILLATGLNVALAAPAYTPVKWTEFIKVEGQSEYVLAQWLQYVEANRHCSPNCGGRNDA
jgi:hypothetical protein